MELEQATTLAEILLANIGTILALTSAMITTIVAAIAAIWFIARFYFTTKVKLAAHDKKFDDITRILDTMMAAIVSSKGTEAGTSESQSPIGVTEYGKEIAQSINADDFIVRYAHNIETDSTMNAYQIQEKCFYYAQFVMLDTLPKEEKDLIENKAFEEGLTTLEVMRILGIKFRDHKMRQYGMEIKKKERKQKVA